MLIQMRDQLSVFAWLGVVNIFHFLSINYDLELQAYSLSAKNTQLSCNFAKKMSVQTLVIILSCFFPFYQCHISTLISVSLPRVIIVALKLSYFQAFYRISNPSLLLIWLYELYSQHDLFLLIFSSPELHVRSKFLISKVCVCNL